jgi:HlyD family secretion protein
MDQSKTSEKAKRPWWRKMGWWWIVPIVIVVAGAGAAYYFLGIQTTASSAASNTPTYNTTRVTRGDILISAAGSGTLVANPLINLSFSTSGRVGQLKVKVGDTVKTGDMLAQLDNLEQLQATIANNELAVIQAQQAVDNLDKNALVNLSTAYQTWVTAQKTYNDAQTAQLRTAYARCSKDQNTKYLLAYQNALDKVNKLTVSAPGTDSLLTAENDYDTALANYTYCISFTQDEVTSAKASADVAKMQLDQAKTNYDTLTSHNGVDPQTLDADQASLKQAQLQLAQSQSDLAGATLMAPINGTIISIAANQGEVVDTSIYIVMADLSQSKVQVQINETDMNKMAVGNTAQIVFDAVPQHTFTGKVTQINPALTTSGQTTVVTGLIALDQPPTNPANNHLLPLGMNSNVTIINNQANNVVMVSQDALRDLGDGTYGVFALDQDKKLRLKTVQVGLKDSLNAEIKSGLNPGDVVSTGSARAVTQ